MGSTRVWTCQTNIYAAACLWKMGFLEYFSATRILHSWPALLLPQTPNPAVSQHSSRKCVYGLSTSGEAFQSAGASFHFQVSAQVNTAMCARTICRDSRLCRWQVQKQAVTFRSPLGGRRAAPCWPPCTGRRTSVCPPGPRTPSERSSGCSRARPELQRKQQHPSNLNLRVWKLMVSFLRSLPQSSHFRNEKHTFGTHTYD